MSVFSILTCSWGLSNCLRCSLMCSSCTVHSAFSFDRRSWRLRNSSSRWLYWNLANVACPEPKREEDRSFAATELWSRVRKRCAKLQPLRSCRYRHASLADSDTAVVHFRLVWIRSDQVNTPSVLSDSFFKDQKLLKRNYSGLNKKLQNFQNLNGTTTYVVVLYDEMEFLVRFLKEENHIIAATAQPSQLDFTTSMIQEGHTFEHEPNRVAEQKLRCFEFLVLVNLASILL